MTMLNNFLACPRPPGLHAGMMAEPLNCSLAYNGDRVPTGCNLQACVQDANLKAYAESTLQTQCCHAGGEWSSALPSLGLCIRMPSVTGSLQSGRPPLDWHMALLSWPPTICWCLLEPTGSQILHQVVPGSSAGPPAMPGRADLLQAITVISVSPECLQISLPSRPQLCAPSPVIRIALSCQIETL